jgi:hypothetical protein
MHSIPKGTPSVFGKLQNNRYYCYSNTEMFIEKTNPNNLFGFVYILSAHYLFSDPLPQTIVFIAAFTM